MIDYKKLKIAHEIMLKANRYYCLFEFGWNDKVRFQVFNDENEICLFTTFDVDDLITRLQELIKHKPKYKIGQLIWCVDDDYSPHSFVIESIDFDNNEQQVSYGEPNVTGCYWLQLGIQRRRQRTLYR